MKTIILCIVIVILAGCGDEGNTTKGLQPLTGDLLSPVALAESFHATPLASKVLKSTVYITVSNSKESSDGSGFVCRPNLIATAYHIIDSAYSSKTPTYIKVQSVLGGEFYSATEIVAINVDRDIAILRVPLFTQPALSLANSNSAYVGQLVLACGNPDGYIGTYSFGIISGFRFDVGPLLKGRSIQITASISAGSSGGPVCDEKGQVIGIVSLSDVDGNDLNFLTPSNALKEMLDQIPAD